MVILFDGSMLRSSNIPITIGTTIKQLNNRTIMFKNYFITAFRNLWRNKIFSIIKILGFGIGLTVCMLIFLYTKDEISYDQFHKHKSELYRVIQTWQFGKDPAQTLGITNAIIGESFAREIPEV